MASLKYFESSIPECDNMEWKGEGQSKGIIDAEKKTTFGGLKSESNSEK